MKKFIFILLGIIIILVVLLFVGWNFRTALISHHISKALKVSVSIGNLDYSKNHLIIGNLWIGNPPQSKTSTAFSSRQIDIYSTWKDIRGEVMTINDLEISDIALNVEYYNKSGDVNNWSVIMDSGSSEKKSSRPYLIKTLVLNNLTVTVTDANGKATTYPMIKQLVIHNIYDETGFPIDQIEKAIFNLMLKQALQQLSLPNLIKTVVPQLLPKKLPLF